MLHRDYGVSADEAAVRQFGIDAFDWLFRGGALPTQQDWNFFNPIVTVIMRSIELGLGLTDGADIWFMRHLMTFCMFFVTVIAFYHIAWMRFRDWKLPLLGSLMFMVSPRIFAHGFYNPKDLPAMMLFAVSAWTMLLFLEKRTAVRFIIHILCTALLISMRMFGLMMPVLAILFLCMSPRVARRGAASVSRDVLTLIPTQTLVLALIWPLLWNHPISGLIGAFFNTTSRSGGGFYFGHAFSSAGVPWHYLPIWIGITTPVIYSAFFLTGLVALWIRCIHNPLGLLTEKQPAGLALLWFLLPVAALMVLPIGIFDEWRHVLFLYPAFLLITLEGVWWVTNLVKKIFSSHSYIHIWIYGILIMQMISTGAWMTLNHPFEYAYFSIPTRFIEDRFDLDYWGLGYRAGLEWIAKNDDRAHINVYTAARVGKTGADTLPIEDWDRLYFTTPDKADYILDNFRGHEYRQVFPEERKVHSIMVDGLEILTVYTGPDTSRIFEPIAW